MTAIDGVIDDLCHLLGINIKTLHKIEIFGAHVEAWYYDADRILRFKCANR